MKDSNGDTAEMIAVRKGNIAYAQVIRQFIANKQWKKKTNIQDVQIQKELDFIEGKTEVKVKKTKRKNKKNKAGQQVHAEITQTRAVKVDEINEQIREITLTDNHDEDDMMTPSTSLSDLNTKKVVEMGRKMVVAKRRMKKTTINMQKERLTDQTTQALAAIDEKISKIDEANADKNKQIDCINESISLYQSKLAELETEKQKIETEKRESSTSRDQLMLEKYRLEAGMRRINSGVKCSPLIDRKPSMHHTINVRETKSIEQSAQLESDKSAPAINEAIRSFRFFNSNIQDRVLDMMDRSISEKIADLECPVCLETAKIPIYTCAESHVLCSKCRPKLSSCPQCRQNLGKFGFKRHRFAEKVSVELEMLETERLKYSTDRV